MGRLRNTSLTRSRFKFKLFPVVGKSLNGVLYAITLFLARDLPYLIHLNIMLHQHFAVQFPTLPDIPMMTTNSCPFSQTDDLLSDDVHFRSRSAPPIPRFNHADAKKLVRINLSQAPLHPLTPLVSALKTVDDSHSNRIPSKDVFSTLANAKDVFLASQSKDSFIASSNEFASGINDVFVANQKLVNSTSKDWKLVNTTSKDSKLDSATMKDTNLMDTKEKKSPSNFKDFNLVTTKESKTKPNPFNITSSNPTSNRVQYPPPSALYLGHVSLPPHTVSLSRSAQDQELDSSLERLSCFFTESEYGTDDDGDGDGFVSVKGYSTDGTVDLEVEREEEDWMMV